MTRNVLIFCTLVLMYGIGGCTPFKLQQSVRVNAGDWTMYGGNKGRTNVALSIVTPPLTVAWEYDASAGFNPFSAVAADSFLFVANLQGEVHAIQIRTGNGVGVHDFGAAIVGAPIIDKEILYVALTREENNIVAYDLDAGAVKWQSRIGDVESSPLLIDDRLYVALLEGKIICLAVKEGTEVWSFTVPSHQKTAMVRSSPASDGEVIVFGCDNGNVYAVGNKDGKLRWSVKTDASVVASPSISGGRVFIGSLDACYYAFDAATGKQLWKRWLGSKIYASQALGDQYVFIGTSGGIFYCLDQATGNIVWQVSMNSVVNAAPLVSGNVVYVASLDKTLNALSIATGERLWQYKAPGRVKTMPVALKGYLFLLVEDRTVFGFKEGTGK